MIKLDRLNINFDLNFDQTSNLKLTDDYNDLNYFNNFDDLNNWLIVNSDNSDEIVNIE